MHNYKRNQSEIDRLESDNNQLREIFNAAKREIIDDTDQKPHVEQLLPRIDQMYREKKVKLERDIIQEQRTIEDCKDKINLWRAVAYLPYKTPEQQALYDQLKNTIGSTYQNQRSSESTIKDTENKLSELERKKNWRKYLQEEHKKELHELTKIFAEQSQIVETQLFNNLHQIAKSPLENLDLQTLQSFFDRYHNALDEANQAVKNAKESEQAKQRKGKGLAAGYE